MSLQYELEHLRFELRKALEENERLRQQLDSEKERHRQTLLQRDDLKARHERSYDAYVTQTHEGYMPQAEYDDVVTALRWVLNVVHGCSRVDGGPLRSGEAEEAFEHAKRILDGDA